MKFARIDDQNTCAEFIGFDPVGKFHPDIKWVEVPEYLHAYVNHEYKLEGDEIVPPTLDYLRDQVKAKLADLRYQRETAGITLPDGTEIHTYRESQAQITGAFNTLKNELLPYIRWKAKTGFVNLTLAEVEPVAQAVAFHVAKCFEAEEAVIGQIDALETVKEIAEFDIETALDVEIA